MIFIAGMCLGSDIKFCCHTCVGGGLEDTPAHIFYLNQEVLNGRDFLHQKKSFSRF